MEIFGENWHGHPKAFFEGWRNTVGEQDLVIIPGDLSWAMHLGAALLDLRDLDALPGTKIILRGNHDYWWPSISRLRAALPPSILALQNDSVVVENVAVAGTRGWVCPSDRSFSEGDTHIYQREVGRLQLSIHSLANQTFTRLVIALHYPPTATDGEPTEFTREIEAVRPDAVVFGHLHGLGGRELMSDWKGVPLHLVAADHLGFKPKMLFEL